jgi:hypothetical protein
MTREFDKDGVTRIAVALGITLTEANEGTDHYERWAARVMQAQMHFERGEHDLCKVMIDEANRCAPPLEAAPGDYLTDAEYAELQGDIDPDQALKPSRPKKHCERYDPDAIPF